MLSLFAIPIVSQATGFASGTSSYFLQPLDAILFDILIWFGWIPIVMTLGWGFTQMWLDYRRGLYSAKLKYILLAVDVPTMTEQTPKALENFFASIYGTKSSITWKEKWIGGKLHPVFSFEIISTEGYIRFLIRTQARFRDVMEAGIYAHYPDAEISEVEDYAKSFPNEFPNDEYEMWGGEMTFDKPSMYPIRTYIDFEDRMTQEIKDPLGLTLEQLAKMRPGEHFWIQILVQPSSNDWAKASVKHVRKIYGDEDAPKKSLIASTFESVIAWPTGLLNETLGIDLSGLLSSGTQVKEVDPWKTFKITLPQKDEAEAILRKATKVGYGVKLRILYVARKSVFQKVERTGMVKGILNQYSHLNFNKFALYIPQVPKDDYFWMRWEYTQKQHRLMTGYQKRSWGIGANPIWLNVEELATLWHFPTITMKAPLVKKSESKRGEPPVGLPITFLEDTLPGFIPPKTEEQKQNYFPEFEEESEKKLEPESSSESTDPFEDLVQPVLPRQTFKKSLEDDDVVPPNLPV
ncbi:hypothetical protein HYV70_03140 [Candidatus Uhrbacteria bacterium]|nr:hypothetical protein [Candidatus Uhrbacteria bacterium]